MQQNGRLMMTTFVVFLSLGARCPAFCEQSPAATLTPKEEAAIVEPVVRQEIAENRFSTLGDVCLFVDGTRPSRGMMRELKSRRLRLQPCPRGWWPSKSIHVTVGSLRDAETIEVKAETADQDNRDVGILLREGTYTLRRKSAGEWSISGYTKTCCDPDKGRISNPEMGNAGQGRGGQ